MSSNAEIVLIGKSRDELLKEIQGIKHWDNGMDLPIIVKTSHKSDGICTFDSIQNVENAIINNLEKYIEEIKPRDMIISRGINDDLILNPAIDHFANRGMFKKYRHKPTNSTPKKKKRKKR